jgi:hypothetical protein
MRSGSSILEQVLCAPATAVRQLNCNACNLRKHNWGVVYVSDFVPRRPSQESPSPKNAHAADQSEAAQAREECHEHLGIRPSAGAN